MPGLFMKLAPYERFIVNGALIANGNRRSMINVIQPNAVVLREKELLTPQTAETEIGLLVMLAQNALLGLIDYDTALDGLNNITPAFSPDPAARIASHLADASIAQTKGDLRAVYISLERAFRVEVRLRRSSGG